jgi:hypothetical protein
MPTPMLLDGHDVIDRDTFLDDPKVYKETKDAYIEMLIDTGRYTRASAEHTED